MKVHAAFLLSQALVWSCFLTITFGFVPNSRRVSNFVSMKPVGTKFTQLRAESQNQDDGYAPVDSLLRQGPVPFFIRLVQPDKYNSAVDKYMKLEKCSRTEAMANMDAYFQGI